MIKKDFKKFKTLVIFHGNAGHLSNRIYKLNELYKSGALNQEEFEKAKKKILDN